MQYASVPEPHATLVMSELSKVQGSPDGTSKQPRDNSTGGGAPHGGSAEEGAPNQGTKRARDQSSGSGVAGASVVNGKSGCGSSRKTDPMDEVLLNSKPGAEGGVGSGVEARRGSGINEHAHDSRACKETSDPSAGVDLGGVSSPDGDEDPDMAEDEGSKSPVVNVKRSLQYDDLGPDDAVCETAGQLLMHALAEAIRHRSESCYPGGTREANVEFREAMDYFKENGLHGFYNTVSANLKAGTHGKRGVGWAIFGDEIGAPSGKCSAAESCRTLNDGRWFSAFFLQDELSSESYLIRASLGKRLLREYEASTKLLSRGSQHRDYHMRRTVGLVIGRFQGGSVTNFPRDPLSYFVSSISRMFMRVMDTALETPPETSEVEFPLKILVTSRNKRSWLADLAVLAACRVIDNSIVNCDIRGQLALKFSRGHDVGEEDCWRCLEQHGLSERTCSAMKVGEYHIAVSVDADCKLGKNLEIATVSARGAMKFRNCVFVVDTRDGSAVLRDVSLEAKYDPTNTTEPNVEAALRWYVGKRVGDVLPCSREEALCDRGLELFVKLGGECVCVTSNLPMVSTTTIDLSQWVSFPNPIVQFCCSGSIKSRTFERIYPSLHGRIKTVDALRQMQKDGCSPNQHDHGGVSELSSDLDVEGDGAEAISVYLDAHRFVVAEISKVPVIMWAQLLGRWATTTATATAACVADTASCCYYFVLLLLHLQVLLLLLLLPLLLLVLSLLALQVLLLLVLLLLLLVLLLLL